MRGNLDLSRIRRAVRIRDRAGHRSERWAIHAVARAEVARAERSDARGFFDDGMRAGSHAIPGIALRAQPRLRSADQRRQPRQRCDDRIGLRTMSLEGGAGAVDPDRGETERFCARDIPAIRRYEADPYRQKLEVIYGELVDAGARLVNACGIDGQDGVEMQGYAGRRRQRFKHLARTVG